MLSRCVPHAFDNRTPSIDTELAMFIFYESEVGIHLSSAMPASLKINIYHNEIVSTPTKIYRQLSLAPREPP